MAVAAAWLGAAAHTAWSWLAAPLGLAAEDANERDDGLEPGAVQVRRAAPPSPPPPLYPHAAHRREHRLPPRRLPPASRVQALEALAALSAEVEAAAKRVGAVNGQRQPELCLQLLEELRVCQQAWTAALGELYRTVFETTGPDRQYRFKFHPSTLELAPYPAHVLYTADVLHAGGMIEGSAALSDHLRPAAARLVRLVTRLRLNLAAHDESETVVPIPLQLQVLEKAWHDFEWLYLDALATPAPAPMTEALLRYVVHLSETLAAARRQGWTTAAEIDRIEPALVIALNRAALLTAARIPELAEVLRPLFASSLPPPSPDLYEQLVTSVGRLADADVAHLLHSIYVPHVQALDTVHHALFLLLCGVVDEVRRRWPRASGRRSIVRLTHACTGAGAAAHMRSFNAVRSARAT